MEMPDFVKCKLKRNLLDIKEPRICYDDDAITYHHDRIVKAKDARIAELEAILEARGE